MTTEISFSIHYKIKGDNLDQCIAKARSLLKEDVGVDEYFRTHTEARRYANSMVEEGYDDVYLEENVDAKETN